MRVINAIIDGIKSILALILAYIGLAVCMVIALVFPQKLASDEEIAQELADMKEGKGGKKK